MIIKPSPKATRRTKTRITENGPQFTLERESESCFAVGNRPAIMVSSNSTAWFGWFPLEEIEVVDV